ncbi:MAG TPA: hypothetical protein VFA63_11445 [Pseudonocardiaceae bacterium]|nr:hypothetical protein [Pseudonocardiaceae bacterium]
MSTPYAVRFAHQRVGQVGGGSAPQVQQPATVTDELLAPWPELSPGGSHTISAALRATGRQHAQQTPAQGPQDCRLTADGFEKVGLVIPLGALKLADANVDLVSLRHVLGPLRLHGACSRWRRSQLSTIAHVH